MKKLKRAWGSGVLVWPGAAAVLAAEAAVRVSPETFALLAPFGLIYPWTLLVLAAGAVWRLVTGDLKGLIVPAVVLVVSWTHAVETWGGWWSPAADVRVNPGNELELLSWNVRLFDRYNQLGGEPIRDSILAVIDREGADVVCLQECYIDEGKEAWMRREKLEGRAGTGFWHADFSHEIDSQTHFGLVTLSKHPIVRSEVIRFDNDANNSCIVTDIVVASDTLRIFNAHLSSIRFDRDDYQAVRTGPDPEERAKLWARMRRAWIKRASQAREVAEAVAASPYPVILAGDFNDSPVSYALHRFDLLEDAFAAGGEGLGGTYIGDLPPLRIDYILHSPSLTARSFVTLDEELSDHRPLRARFTISAQ
jgi:endonuclease/exonuclease/phosphatase family metal-dependent hydrolase